MKVEWDVYLHDGFLPEYGALAEEVQDELLARIRILKEFGPQLGRPHVDSLNGSRHANMKELRCSAAGGVWRFAFAFDPERNAIILCGGDKSGSSEKRFYRRLIAKADDRFDTHLADLKQRAVRNRLEVERKNGHEAR